MWVPVKKMFGPHSKGGQAKNVNTKSKILTFSRRMTWGWSETVNLYGRKTIILPVKVKQSHYRPASPEGSRRLRLPDF